MPDTCVNKSLCFSVYEEAIKRLDGVLTQMANPPFKSKNRLDPAKDVRLFHRMTIHDSDDGTRTVEVKSYMNAHSGFRDLHEDTAIKWAAYLEGGTHVDMEKMYSGYEYWFTRNAVTDIEVCDTKGVRVYSFYDDRSAATYAKLFPSQILKIGHPVHEFTLKYLPKEKS